MFRKRRKTKGQAIVEMALVFPFFLLIVVGGLIDFGFAFYNFLSLQQIANETAQWAAESFGSSIPQSNTAIVAHANSLRPNWWTGAFTVNTPFMGNLVQDPGSQFISVTLSYESPTFTPFWQILFQAATGAQSIRLAAQAAYKIPRMITTH
ncbi:MAG: TadE/TadG family type IV pilus assembly protein [Candidatus Riflebacteria bacterium]